jgi:DNA-binding transcriptional MocR family regulator
MGTGGGNDRVARIIMVKARSRTKVAASKPGLAAGEEPGTSWLPRISADRSVKYTTIASAMAEAIESGKLAEGQRLPPHRDLATQLGVTVATVTKAIADLARKGLLDTRRGAGTFVTRGSAPSPRHPAPASALVDLAISRPLAARAAPFLRDALQAVAADMAEAFGYEVVGGSAAHRRAGVAWVARREVAVAEDEVLLTQGGNDGLLAALAATCRQGDAVACEALNYSGIRRLAQLLGVRLIAVETDDRGMRADALDAACRAEPVKAVLCTPVTHNPTGASMNARRIAEIVACVRRHDAVLIENDIYGHLSGTLPPILAHLPDRTIHVTSMSKGMSAGLRAGFLVVPRGMAGQLRDALYATSWTAPALHGAVAAHLIASGAAWSVIAAQREEALQRIGLARRILGAALATDSRVPCYHIWLTMTEPVSAEEVAGELGRAGIMVAPARSFALHDVRVPNALRIGLGAVSERATLERALHEVARHIAGAQMSIGAIA